MSESTGGGWGSLWGGGGPAVSQEAMMNPQQQQLLAQPGAAYGPQVVASDQQGVNAWALRNGMRDPTEVRADGSTGMGTGLSAAQKALAGAGGQQAAPAAPGVAPMSAGQAPHSAGGGYQAAAYQQMTPGNPYMQQSPLAARALALQRGGLLDA